MSKPSDKWGVRTVTETGAPLSIHDQNRRCPESRPGRPGRVNAEAVLGFLRGYAERTRFGATAREIMTGVGVVEPTDAHRGALADVMERLLDGGVAVRDWRGPGMYRAADAEELYAEARR